MNKIFKPVFVDNRGLRDKDPIINKHFEAVEIEAKQFLKIQGVIRDSKFIRFVKCPVCNSSKNRQLFIKFGFVHSECSNCTHIYVKNILRDSYLLDLYSKSIADELSSRRKDHKILSTYWRLVYGKYFSDVLGFTKKSKSKVLDYGCGAGHFLEFAKKNYSFDLYGLDYCEYSRAHLEQLIGNNFLFKYSNALLAKKFINEFDVVSMWGVLEHVTSPNETLKTISRILKKAGILIVLVPNFHSRAGKILGTNNPTLNPRSHINFYTRKSMDILCSNHNFRLLKTYQELPIIDLMYDHVDADLALINSIIENNESYYHVYVLEKM